MCHDEFPTSLALCSFLSLPHFEVSECVQQLMNERLIIMADVQPSGWPKYRSIF